MLSSSQCREREIAAGKAFVPPSEQAECVVGGVNDCSLLQIHADKIRTPETHAFPSEVYDILPLDSLIA